jgi:hypothetical protein
MVGDGSVLPVTPTVIHTYWYEDCFMKGGNKHFVYGTIIMQSSESTSRALQSAGVVHGVDTINRELAVFINGDLLTFDVPVNCKIVLHDERVRLRLVQPRDRVKITYEGHGRSLVAREIEAQPKKTT